MTAKDGDTARIHFTGYLPDRTEFDSSRGKAPLEIVIGSGSHFPGLHAAITGMQVGQTKMITIPAAQAYGPRDPEKVDKVPRAKMPSRIPLTPGGALNAETEDGDTMTVRIVSVDETYVTLDANHPLAGTNIVIEIELLELA